MTFEKKWWQTAVAYQIYPRSYQDSDGDGIGDIKGITSRLDYLKKLGITAIWLSPVYASPMDDNGYDISDYEGIASIFGDMAAMDELLFEANQRGIKLIMDLVVNHTSDEHAWFVEARKSKANLYRDYYVWRDQPNNLTSAFSGSAWQLDEASGQYYLHLFSKKQPDLNWENEKVRKAIYDMMNFWIDKGVGGFRMDVIDLIGKVPDQEITGNGPKLHDYLHEMNQATFGNKDLLTVGETWGATPEIAKLYSAPERQELAMIFQFEHISLSHEPENPKWDVIALDKTKFKAVISKWQTDLAVGEGWNSLFWNNHDLPRAISIWGNDQDNRIKSAKAFAILFHFMRGTPFIYQGEEIGMVNAVYELSEYDDIELHGNYEQYVVQQQTISHDAFMQAAYKVSRDHARTPMQWSDDKHAGFSDGQPWLKVNPRFPEINVANDLASKQSIFAYYQKLIQLRKSSDLLLEGSFELLLPDDDNLFIYKRSWQGDTWLIVANFSEEMQPFPLATECSEIILTNSDRQELSGQLKPYEAFIAKL